MESKTDLFDQIPCSFQRQIRRFILFHAKKKQTDVDGFSVQSKTDMSHCLREAAGSQALIYVIITDNRTHDCSTIARDRNYTQFRTQVLVKEPRYD